MPAEQGIEFTIDADHAGTIYVTATDHGLEHCDGPYEVSGEMPPLGLALHVHVYVIALGRRVFRLTSSPRNAYNGDAIMITEPGRGPFRLRRAAEDR